jgi:hypothetical protein
VIVHEEPAWRTAGVERHSTMNWPAASSTVARLSAPSKASGNDVAAENAQERRVARLDAVDAERRRDEFRVPDRGAAPASPPTPVFL